MEAINNVEQLHLDSTINTIDVAVFENYKKQDEQNLVFLLRHAELNCDYNRVVEFVDNEIH
jgi:hypothetical protein